MENNEDILLEEVELHPRTKLINKCSDLGITYEMNIGSQNWIKLSENGNQLFMIKDNDFDVCVEACNQYLSIL